MALLDRIVAILTERRPMVLLGEYYGRSRGVPSTSARNAPKSWS